MIQRINTSQGLANSSAKLLPINSVIFSSRATIGEVTIAKVETATNQGFKNFICNELLIKHEFMYEILKLSAPDIANLASGMTFKEISKTDIANFRIPLPPLSVQQQIVTECEVIDQAATQAEAAINLVKNDIKSIVSNSTFTLKKLGAVANKVNVTIDPQTQAGTVNYIGLENIDSNNGRLIGEVNSKFSTIKSTKICYIPNDVLYGKLRPNLNKVYLAQEAGICSTDILVFRFENKNIAKFYAHYLLTEAFNQQVLKTVSGQQLPRTSWDKMHDIKIPVPPLAIQSQLVAEIAKLEQQIATHQTTISQAASLKQAVMHKYL